jgi:hypothetical protein
MKKHTLTLRFRHVAQPLLLPATLTMAQIETWSPVVMRLSGWIGHLFFIVFDSLTALMNSSNNE